MLELKVNHEALDLGPDPQITIDEESPVFDKDSIPGGFAFPFSLPVTPRNRRILGFPERIEKSGPMSVEQPFQLFHSGLLRAAGTILVTDAGSEYKAHLKVATGDLSSKIKDKKLRDLDLGGTRTWEWKTEYKRPDDDFALAPIFNSKFYTDTPYATDFSGNLFRINAYESGAFYHASDQFYAICPFPFLSYLVQQIFATYGFQVVENILATDPDFADLIVFTNRDITGIEMVYEDTEVSLGIDQYGEEIFQTVRTGGPTRAVLDFDLADSMPDMLIPDFLMSIRNFLNIAYIINGDQGRIVKRQDLIHAGAAIDITNQAIGSPELLQISTDGFKLEWIKDDEDELWGEEYFQRIENFLDFLEAPVPNQAALGALSPRVNEIRYVTSLDTYFRYQWAEYAEGLFRYQWVSWSRNFQNWIDGNGKEAFSSDVAPILEVMYRRSISTGLIRCPWVDLLGSYSEEIEIPKFALRILFYRGMIQDSLGDLYPFATYDNLGRTGSPLTGKNLSIRFEGDSGVYAQLWKDYLLWWMSRKQITWTIKDPSTLKFNEKYAIDGKHYLLKKRTINLGVNSIAPGECEFYLV